MILTSGAHVALLREQLSQQVTGVVLDYGNERLTKSDEGKLLSGMSITTIVSLSYAEEKHHKKSLEEHLIEYREKTKVFSNLDAQKSIAEKSSSS